MVEQFVFESLETEGFELFCAHGLLFLDRNWSVPLNAFEHLVKGTEVAAVKGKLRVEVSSEIKLRARLALRHKVVRGSSDFVAVKGG